MNGRDVLMSAAEIGEMRDGLCDAVTRYESIVVDSDQGMAIEWSRARRFKQLIFAAGLGATAALAHVYHHIFPFVDATGGAIVPSTQIEAQPDVVYSRSYTTDVSKLFRRCANRTVAPYLGFAVVLLGATGASQQGLRASQMEYTARCTQHATLLSEQRSIVSLLQNVDNALALAVYA